jgi:biofilm PGA synthesis N-glycosyltransferase PgaC
VSTADWVVGIAFFLLLYHWVLYPALIHALAGFGPHRSVPSTAETPKVSILIPAYDEELTIAAKLRNSLQLDYPPDSLEVVVGSDASSDSTDAIVTSFESSGVRLVRIPSRIGSSAVTNRLAAVASGELLLCTDADVLLEPGSVRCLASMFSDPKVGIACVRYERLGRHGHRGESIYDRYESWIKGNESRMGVMVGAYGAGIMMRKECWTEMPADTILGDMWMSTTVLARGLRVVQVHAARALGRAEDPSGEFRRKTRIGRGNLQAFLRRPLLYAPWSGLRGWALFSHKGLRLLIPWLVLAMLAGSAVGALHSVHNRVILAAQLGIWLTCPLPVLPGTRRLKALLAPQYLMLMTLALGYGAVQHLLKPNRGVPERTARTAGWDAPDQ